MRARASSARSPACSTAAPFIGGPEVAAFEHELAAATGARLAVGVSSGTDALLAAFLALGVGPGDEVVTTPLTFFATAGSAARLGARVVFADVDADSLTLDPRARGGRVRPRTRAVVARPPVRPPGRAARGPVPGRRGRRAGHRRRPARRGRGGAVVLSRPRTSARSATPARSSPTTPRSPTGSPCCARTARAPSTSTTPIGGNFRLDALQAAVLRAKLPHLAELDGSAPRPRRRVPRAVLAAAPVPPELRLPAPHPAHVYHQFVIRAPRRDALRAHLAEAGVGTEVYYPVPLHLQPCFEALGYRPGSLPVAERACAEVLARRSTLR